MTQERAHEFSSAIDIWVNAPRHFDIIKRKKVDGETAFVIEEYTLTAYSDINEWERSHMFCGMPDFLATREQNEMLSHELTKHKVRLPFWAYKSVSFHRLEAMLRLWNPAVSSKRLFDEIRSGAAVNSFFLGDPGFVSTTLLKQRAHKRDVLLKILMPRGVSGAGIWHCSRIFEEREFLLNRHKVFLVTDTQRNLPGTKLFITCQTQV